MRFDSASRAVCAARVQLIESFLRRVGRIALCLEDDARTRECTLDREAEHCIAAFTARPNYMRAAFSADSYRARFASAAQTTAGNYNINTEELRRLVVALPPLELQRRYVDFERKTRVSCVEMMKAAAQADSLFDSIVHCAFRGELTAGSGVSKKQLALFDRAEELR
jgi:hypothetical protein